MKICIFTVANRPYVDLAYALYKSIRQFHKMVYFECFLVNPKKKNNFSRIKNDDKLIVNKVKYKGGDEKLFSCHLRICLYEKLLKKDYKLVYWCDADTLIRKNLWNYFKSLYQYDIILWADGISKYKSSMIGINNNLKGKKFIDKWNKLYNFQKKKKWQTDQSTLKKTIQRSNVKINLLRGHRNKFFDLEFTNKSFIWIGKGNRKNCKKYRHYMNLLLKK